MKNNIIMHLCNKTKIYLHSSSYTTINVKFSSAFNYSITICCQHVASLGNFSRSLTTFITLEEKSFVWVWLPLAPHVTALTKQCERSVSEAWIVFGHLRDGKTEVNTNLMNCVAHSSIMRKTRDERTNVGVIWLYCLLYFRDYVVIYVHENT